MRDAESLTPSAPLADAVAAIATLQGIANQLQLRSAAELLRQAGLELRAGTVKLLAVGRTEVGASTLLNALLGAGSRPVADLADGGGPLPTVASPWAADFTRIDYADRPAVRVRQRDESTEEWPFARFLRGPRPDHDEEPAAIGTFSVGYPSALCRAGMAVLVGPRLDDTPARLALTVEALRECALALVVFRSDALAGQGERDFVRDHLLATGTKTFIVVNLWGETTVDARLLAFTWNRLVTQMCDGPAYDGQSAADLAAQHDIYFVNARQAAEGRVSGAAGLVAASGLGALEQRLTGFVLHERATAQQRKFLRSAETQGREIEESIARRRAALRADAEQFQSAAAALEPRLAAVATAQGRLPDLAPPHRARCQQETQDSLRQLVARLRITVPDELAALKLTALRRPLVLPSHRRAAMAEAAAFCTQLVSESIGHWVEGDAQRIEHRHIVQFIDDVDANVAAIDAEFGEIHFALTGYAPDVMPSADRAYRSAEGPGAIPRYSGVFSPGAWSGPGVYGPITHVTIGRAIARPLLTLGGVIAGLITPRLVLEKRLKCTLIEGSGDKRGFQQLLTELSESLSARIDQDIARDFGRFEQIVLDAVTAKVVEETDNIHKMIEMNTRSQAEKERELARLDQIGQEVATPLRQLRQLQATAGFHPAGTEGMPSW